MTRGAWWWPGWPRSQPRDGPGQGPGASRSVQHDGPAGVWPDGRRAGAASDLVGHRRHVHLVVLLRPTPSRSTRPPSTSPVSPPMAATSRGWTPGVGRLGHAEALAAGVHVDFRSAVRELLDRDREARRQREDGDGAVVGIRSMVGHRRYVPAGAHIPERRAVPVADGLDRAPPHAVRKAVARPGRTRWGAPAHPRTEVVPTQQWARPARATTRLLEPSPGPDAS